jgi:hypothetical protein
MVHLGAAGHAGRNGITVEHLGMLEQVSGIFFLREVHAMR